MSEFGDSLDVKRCRAGDRDLHRTMIAEVVEKYEIEPKSVVSYLKKNWGIIKGLNKVWSAVEIIKRIENLRIVEIDRERVYRTQVCFQN